jgi:hypothetical protein
MADGKNIGDAILAKLSPLMQLAANAIGEPGFIRYLEATASQIREGLNKRLAAVGMPALPAPEQELVEQIARDGKELDRLWRELEKIAALKGNDCAAAPALAAKALKGEPDHPAGATLGEPAVSGSAAKH